jgi:hypothetical protein
MRTHPGLYTLLAHADGELTVDEERDIARHAADCSACSASLAELRGSSALFAGTLHVLDGAEPEAWSSPSHDAEPLSFEPPTAEPSDVVPTVPVIPLARRASPPATRHALRWAAGIALVTGAAASAAIIADRVSTAGEPPVNAEPTAAVEPAVATVIATPRAGVLRVTLTGAGAGSRLHVLLVDAAEPSVAVEGGDSPHFTAAVGSVAVDLRGSAAAVRVTAPTDLRELMITFDGVPLAISRDGVLTPPDAGTSGVPIDTAARIRME